MPAETSREVYFGPVRGECHCNECGLAFYEGDKAYYQEDTDGSWLWYCDEHVPAPPCKGETNGC